ncbi:nuclease-related domain-containing DEAD/DEAH box helicase [Nostoc sp. JL33]|uniref:NERD domain-containing protein n=1 Tax=Nostoc sp. JL33 TaxID=2815396 RepID=UPI0025DB1B97|nr:nuclease-related domain-containing DEAD/DEAH box helicase [Nostoc sp. JL33]
MEFFPFEAFDNNEAQKKIWEWLKEAFKNDSGVAYYRYPVFTRTGRLNREPDILILHQELGLWVIECKSYSINNVSAIQGHEWQMNNWYNESETPVAQAEDQMFAIKNKLDERRETRGKVNCHFRVALPNIKQKEWEGKEFHQLPSAQGVVLVYENLTPSSLRKHLTDNAQKCQLSDKDWEFAKGVLGGTLPSKEPRCIPTGTPPNNPIRVIQYIESQLKILDSTQQKIAFEVPEGAQRLRGLAGTGKTVLLAKRAAKIHIKHPDWTIGFIFFTRSLYDQILELIALYHREMHPDNADPNWTKLKVLHAWGAKDQQGFYRDLASKCGIRAKTLNDVRNEIGNTSPGDSFEYICLSLLRDRITQIKNQNPEKYSINIELISEIISFKDNDILENKKKFDTFFPESLQFDLFPSLYDALLIDEGQDLPPILYQLAYQILSDPVRLYWAYDEAQGIGSLIVPDADTIFGRNPDGSLVVDLRGNYEGGILKGHRMKKCYRTPRFLLMTAHAINMGLFREGGALQAVTRKNQWEALGYEILEGNFQAVGKPVTITRPDSESPHPIDQKDFELKDAVGSSLVVKTFSSENEECKWIAQQVGNDIKLGFDPWDIVITALSGDYEKEYFSSMKIALQGQGIKSYIAGVDGSPSIFRINECVTISNIYRAKGNEAWKVYACRFNYATEPLLFKQEEELHKRNEAFVAITRARVWCVVTGLDSPIFDELQKAIEQYPNFTFPAFNKNSLKRVTEEQGEDLATASPQN